MPTKTRARPSPPKRDAARPVVVPYSAVPAAPGSFGAVIGSAAETAATAGGGIPLRRRHTAISLQAGLTRYAVIVRVVSARRIVSATLTAGT